jgi:hypothetical protein
MSDNPREEVIELENEIIINDIKDIIEDESDLKLPILERVPKDELEVEDENLEVLLQESVPEIPSFNLRLFCVGLAFSLVLGWGF